MFDTGERHCWYKVVVAEEYEDDDGLDDEDVDGPDDDNIGLSVLLYNDNDHHYLQSLPELEWEGILGERYDWLKNEINMKKALRQARQKD